MYSATTNGIRITVEPEFLEHESEPDQEHYFWAYTIEIENCTPATVQLLARHWSITDSNGLTEEVRGLGVVGEQPVIAPGDSFVYTSGCPLNTPSGIMVGTYQMAGPEGDVFSVEIPAFSLDLPDVRRLLN